VNDLKNTAYPNVVEFQVTGDYGLFTDPIMRVGGEKCTYQVPTYEALKGILSSVYWKPTFVWRIDQVRIMNQIQPEVKGTRTILYEPKTKKGKKITNDLFYYTYLKNCCYQVRAHFEWNENRPELAQDRNENKHHNIAKRMIEKGGRRDIFLGARECQGYVEPCRFGEGTGAYDSVPELGFGLMYHGITYADEAYSEETKGMMTANFWYPTMKNGVITFPPPEDCPLHKPLRSMEIKPFGEALQNFSGLREFGEVD
jgi:CRISPR-associated protein Cas5d